MLIDSLNDFTSAKIITNTYSNNIIQIINLDNYDLIDENVLLIEFEDDNVELIELDLEPCTRSNIYHEYLILNNQKYNKIRFYREPNFYLRGF